MAACYPPIHHNRTEHITTSAALSSLSAYLEATTTDPSLHPNALLTEGGPTTQSLGANVGLVLHNLKRVEAGLKGEHLGADLTFENFGGQGLPDLMGEDAIAGATEKPIGEMERQGQTLEGEWQEKEEFERQQEMVQGEIGERDNAPSGGFNQDNGRTPRVKVTKSNGQIDARREAKKERRKKGKVEREAKRRREKAAEG